MVIKSENLNKPKFPNWKIHSRSGNFNKRLNDENDTPWKWKTWANSITENITYMETFVNREGLKEYDFFYSKWKYPIINSRLSLEKVYSKLKSQWLDREYQLTIITNHFANSSSLDYSSLYEILALDETTRLNLYVNQSKQIQKEPPNCWKNCIQRARLSLSRRSPNELGRHYIFWDWCFRRIKRGFIGNKNGIWDSRFNVIRKINNYIFIK